VPAIEIGRICAKVAGREAGRKCVIVDVVDKSFVLITGPKKVTGVRRRRANISHIEPLQDSVEIKRGASDDEVAEVLRTSGKLEAIGQSVKPALASA
jgi:large subunit ribosomal protein L14e